MWSSRLEFIPLIEIMFALRHDYILKKLTCCIWFLYIGESVKGITWVFFFIISQFDHWDSSFLSQWAVILFKCLFVWGFRSHWIFFHSDGDVIITGKGLQILTYAWHSWPLSSDTEGSLACHTYCDKGHPFINDITGDPWHSHLLRSVWQWSCHYLFLRLRSVDAGIRTPNLPLARRTL